MNEEKLQSNLQIFIAIVTIISGIIAYAMAYKEVIVEREFLRKELNKFKEKNQLIEEFRTRMKKLDGYISSHEKLTLKMNHNKEINQSFGDIKHLDQRLYTVENVIQNIEHIEKLEQHIEFLISIEKTIKKIERLDIEEDFFYELRYANRRIRDIKNRLDHIYETQFTIPAGTIFHTTVQLENSWLSSNKFRKLTEEERSKFANFYGMNFLAFEEKEIFSYIREE